MKQPFSMREKIVVVVGSLIIVFLIVCIAILYHNLQAKDRLIENRSALLREKELDANETAAYIETICTEYRKLYQSYRQARFPDPSVVDKYIGLPGSAKGQIDDCYKPD